MTMEDVQNHRDDRQIPNEHLGVSNLGHSIVVWDRQHEMQQTTVCLTMSVNLPHAFKRTNMSRFIEVLNEHRGEVSMRTPPAILEQ